MNEAQKLQRTFFRKMGSMQQFRFLFDHVPDVGFFAKDAEGRIMLLTALVQRFLGCKCEEEWLGKKEAGMHSPMTLRAIQEDDLAVLRTGLPIINRIEMLFSTGPGAGWYCTTKLPIFDSSGLVIGTMGITRPFSGSLGQLPDYSSLAPAIDYIERHYSEPFEIGDLARVCGISQRQLSERFKTVFCMSVTEFITRRRLQLATDALRSSKSLLDIAMQFGFSDQSHFTRLMRKFVGETPAQARRRLSPTRKIYADTPPSFSPPENFD